MVFQTGDLWSDQKLTPTSLHHCPTAATAVIWELHLRKHYRGLMYVWIGLFETVRGSIASVHSLATAERPGIAPSKKCSKRSRLLIDGTCIVLFVQLHRASCWPNVPYDFQTRVMYIVLT